MIKKIILTFIFYILFLPVCIAIILFSITSGLIDKKKNIPFKIQKIWADLCLRLVNAKIEISGEEHIDKNKIYFITPNHQSAFDIMVLFKILKFNFRFIIKKEYFNVPLLGQAMKSANHIEIDRYSSIKSIINLKKAIDNLKKFDFSIVIFPEGTRSLTGKINQFKTGIAFLVQQTSLPVLPIVIKGTIDILPKGKFLINTGKIIKIKILKPIEAKINRKNRTEFVSNLQKIIMDEYEKL